MKNKFLKIDVSSGQTCKGAGEDHDLFSKITVNKQNEGSFFNNMQSLLLKHMKKVFSFFVSFLKKEYCLYIYYIVINNNIYNNKNEDCIGEKSLFSSSNQRKVPFLPKNLQRLRGY